MEASKSSAGEKAAQISATWGSGSSLQQVFVDELLVSLAKGRAYLTFGQLTIPVTTDLTNAKAEITPVARIVVNRESLRPMVDLLNRLMETEEK